MSELTIDAVGLREDAALLAALGSWEFGGNLIVLCQVCHLKAHSMENALRRYMCRPETLNRLAAWLERKHAPGMFGGDQ